MTINDKDTQEINYCTVCRWREWSRTNRWTEGQTTRSDMWVLVRFSAASQPTAGLTWSASQPGATEHLSSGTLAAHNLLQTEMPGERMSLSTASRSNIRSRWGIINMFKLAAWCLVCMDNHSITDWQCANSMLDLSGWLSLNCCCLWDYETWQAFYKV